MKTYKCKCGLTIREKTPCPICKTKDKVEYLKNMKNECPTCRKDFKNNSEHYRLKGNYCNDCNAQVNNKMKWRLLHKRIVLKQQDIQEATEDGYIIKMISNEPRTTDIKTLVKQLRDLNQRQNQLGYYIESKWGIDIVEDNKDLNDFKGMFYSLLDNRIDR